MAEEKGISPPTPQLPRLILSMKVSYYRVLLFLPLLPQIWINHFKVGTVSTEDSIGSSKDDNPSPRGANPSIRFQKWGLGVWLKW